MAALTRWVLAHRRLVAGAWLALTLAGLFSTTQIGDALERRFDAPGREGFEVNREILAATGAGGSLAPIVLVAGDVDDPVAAFRRVAEAVPDSRLLADPPLAGDVGVRIALLFPPRPPTGLDENPQATAAAERAGAESGVGVTGIEALTESSGQESGGPTLLIEVLFGAAAALASGASPPPTRSPTGSRWRSSPSWCCCSAASTGSCRPVSRACCARDRARRATPTRGSERSARSTRSPGARRPARPPTASGPRSRRGRRSAP